MVEQLLSPGEWFRQRKERGLVEEPLGTTKYRIPTREEQTRIQDFITYKTRARTPTPRHVKERFPEFFTLSEEGKQKERVLQPVASVVEKIATSKPGRDLLTIIGAPAAAVRELAAFPLLDQKERTPETYRKLFKRLGISHKGPLPTFLQTFADPLWAIPEVVAGKAAPKIFTTGERVAGLQRVLKTTPGEAARLIRLTKGTAEMAVIDDFIRQGLGLPKQGRTVGEAFRTIEESAARTLTPEGLPVRPQAGLPSPTKGPEYIAYLKKQKNQAQTRAKETKLFAVQEREKELISRLNKEIGELELPAKAPKKKTRIETLMDEAEATAELTLNRESGLWQMGPYTSKTRREVFDAAGGSKRKTATELAKEKAKNLELINKARAAAGLPPKAPAQAEVVHRMPDGTIMAGPEHAGAVPGSTRPAVKPPQKQISPLKTSTERPPGAVVPPRPTGRVEEIKEFFARKPKPSEPARELGALNREIEGRTQRLMGEQYEASVQFIKQVQQKGGIRPFAKGVELEEYRSAVPNYLRRERGLPPDEMADVLGLETTQGLYDRLGSLPQRMPQKVDFLESAKSLVEIYDTPLLERKQALESIIKAGLGDPAKLPISTISKRLSRVLGRDITPDQAATMMKQTDRLEAEMAQITAKWRAGLATPEQKIEALRLKGARQLTDAEYRRLMQSSTGKATMSMSARNPVTREQAQGFIDYLKEIPELATLEQKAAIIKAMSREKLLRHRLVPPQIKRIQSIFGIRPRKTKPLTFDEAGDTIAAIAQIPPARRGQVRSVPKRIADMADDFAEAAEIPELPADWLTGTAWMPGGGVRTPIAAFQFLGQKAKDAASKFFKLPARRKFHQYTMELNSFGKEWVAKSKNISTKEANRIMIYGYSKDPKSLQLLAKMRIKPIYELTPKEMSYYNWMRDKYGIIDRLNVERGKNWLPLINKKPDYMTHMREISALEEVGEATIYSDINNLIYKNVHLNAPSFQFAKPREYLLRKVNLDAREVIQEYMERALYHANMIEPAARGRILLKALNQKPQTQAFLTQFVDAVSGKPITSSGSPVADMVLQGARQNIGASVLAGKIRSTLIQISSWRNTLTEINWRNIPEAIGWYVSGGREFALNTSKLLRARSPEIVMQRHATRLDKVIAETVLGKKAGKVAAEVKAKGIELGYTGLQVLDSEAATSSWIALYLDKAKKLRAEGKAAWNTIDDIMERPIEEAINYADDMVEWGQASAARISRSPIQQSQLGQTVSMFNTFVISDFGFAARNVAGIGTRRFGKETLEKVAKYLTATALFNMLFEDVIGIYSPFPRPIKTLQEARKKGWGSGRSLYEVILEMSGDLPLLGGLRYGTSLGGAVVDTGKKTYEYVREKFTGERPERPISGIDLTGRVLGIPGSGQVGRIDKSLTIEDTKFPYTRSERIRRMFGGDASRAGQLRSARWDLKNQIRDLGYNISRLKRDDEDYNKQLETRARAKEALLKIEDELDALISPTPEKKLSPAEWFKQRKQKLSPEEWFRQRKAK